MGLKRIIFWKETVRRNCSSLEEYIEKIKNSSFYADEPEIRAISKIKEAWIAIYDELRKTWKIIKDKTGIKPKKIAFICYQDTGADLLCHYNAIKLINRNQSIESKRNNCQSKKDISKDNEVESNKSSELKIYIWNARSLSSFTKKSFLIDIISNELPDLAFISETFLLDQKICM